MFCGQCGYKLSNTAKFCGQCGLKLSPSTKFCRECGYKLSSIAKFCGRCGNPVPYNIPAVNARSLTSKTDNQPNLPASPEIRKETDSGLISPEYNDKDLFNTNSSITDISEQYDSSAPLKSSFLKDEYSDFKNQDNFTNTSNEKDNPLSVRQSKIVFPYFPETSHLRFFYRKYQYFHIKVEKDHEPDIDYTTIKPNIMVSFEKPSDNSKQLRVIYTDANTNTDTDIGYLSNKNLNNMIPKYEAAPKEKEVISCVDMVDDDSKEVWLSFVFYQKLTDEEYEKTRYIETKLIKTSFKHEYLPSRQESLDLVHEGDEVTFEYNFESGTYEVCAPYDIGEIRESVSDKLRQADLRCDIFHGLIYKLDCSPSGKKSCIIRIIFESRMGPLF